MPNSSPRLILFSLCAAQFFMPFMVAAVNAILPPMGNDLGVSVKNLSLLITYYVLGLAIFQLLTGRLGDIWGRRRIFLCGYAIFITVSILTGFMNNIYYMQGLRFIQGAGTAMFNASSLAILASIAPPGMRGRYIGLSGAFVYAGIACGPMIAGFIASNFGWRFFFWSTAAVAFFAWLSVFIFMRQEWRIAKGEPFDFLGSSIYAIAMILFTFSSSFVEEHFYISLILIAFGIVLLLTFAYVEKHSKHPLLDLKLLLSNKVFVLSSTAAFVNYMSCLGMLLLFSIYLQVVRGFSSQTAGLYLAVQFIMQILATLWSGRMTDKHGAEKISAIGIGLCGLGLCGSAFLGQETPMIFFFICQIILGIGIGLFAVPNTTVLLGCVDNNHIGQASSTAGTVRTGGGLFNAIIISASIGHFLGHAPIGKETIEPFLLSMRTDLIFFGILNILAIGCALGRIKATTTAKK